MVRPSAQRARTVNQVAEPASLGQEHLLEGRPGPPEEAVAVVVKVLAATAPDLAEPAEAAELEGLEDTAVGAVPVRDSAGAAVDPAVR
jgi:hypothetical protein